MRRIMAAAGGTRKAAAAAAGIPYSTWGHLMGAKRHASAANVRKIESAFARLVMAPAIAAKIKAKGYPKTITIRAVVVADPYGRRYINRKVDGPNGPKGAGAAMGWRKFKAENISDAGMRRIVDGWLHHGPEAAAQILQGDQHHKGVMEDAYPGSGWAFEGNHVDVELTGKR